VLCHHPRDRTAEGAGIAGRRARQAQPSGPESAFTTVGDDRHEIRQLIVDPHTGQFIGERQVAGAEPEVPWLKPGREIGASTITTAVAGRLGEVPSR
jgi:hypothetical protein